MKTIGGALLVGMLGIMLGLAVPDVDRNFWGRPWSLVLQHRSLLTHSFLLPLALFALARSDRSTALRWFTMGFSVAIAVHLSFDLFPTGWWGYALLYVPFMGRLDPTLSILWLLLSIAASLGLAFALVRYFHELVLVAVALVVTYAIAAAAGQAFWLPLLVLIVLGGIGFVLAFSVQRQRSYS